MSSQRQVSSDTRPPTILSYPSCSPRLFIPLFPPTLAGCALGSASGVVGVVVVKAEAINTAIANGTSGATAAANFQCAPGFNGSVTAASCDNGVLTIGANTCVRMGERQAFAVPWNMWCEQISTSLDNSSLGRWPVSHLFLQCNTNKMSLPFFWVQPLGVLWQHNPTLSWLAEQPQWM